MNARKNESISVIVSKQNSCPTVYDSDRCHIDLIYFKVCGSNNCLDNEKKYLNVIHSHSMYELHMVLDGEMEITLDDGTVLSAPKGHFILIPPLVKHAITGESSSFKKVLASFELSAVKNDDEDFYVNTIRHMKIPTPYKSSARMTKILNIMLDAKKSDLHDKTNMLFEFVICYIIEVCNIINKKNDIKKDDVILDKRVEAAVKFVKENMSVPITTADIARAVYISTKQLGRIFVEHLGQTPADYVKTEKNKYICKLLTETNLSLSDIAEAVGFPDVASLIKKFKSIEGITPAKYRSAIR